MKILLFLIFCLVLENGWTQNIQQDLIVSDTIQYDDFKAYNITVEKCPGYLSGTPCYRYLFINSEEQFTHKDLFIKKGNVCLKIHPKDELIIMMKDEIYGSFFDDILMDSLSGNSDYEMRKVYKKRKMFVNEVSFINPKFYKGKIKTKVLNSLLLNNITVCSELEFVKVLLLYN